MSTNNSNDWVQEGTPREDWDSDTDYGVEVDPAEWDDYSQEQAVPVRTPDAARQYVPPVQPAATEQTPDAEQPADNDALATPTDEAVLPEQASPDDIATQPTAEVIDAPDADADTTDAEDAARETPVSEPVVPETTAPEEVAPEDAASAEPPVAQEASARETLYRDDTVEERPRPVVMAQQQPAEPTHDAATEPHETPTDGLAEPNDAVAQPEQPHEPEPSSDADPDATAVHDAFARPEEDHEPVADQDARLAGAPAAAAAGTGAGFASLYRDDDEPQTQPEAFDQPDEPTEVTEPAVDEHTRVIADQQLAEEEAEEQARQARLQEQRDARDARLGVIASSQDNGVRVVTKPVKRQADKFFGALSLFLLRGVLAAILGVLAYQVLQDVTRTEQFLAGTVIPEPRLVAWILGYGLAVLAALLLIGLGARFFSAVLVLVAGASLALFRWGAFSIFMDGREGFLGDRTLLTLVAALVIVAFGAGRWSVDGAIYAARQASKENADQ